MDGAIQISEAARQLGVTPHYLRLLEWEGRVPPARRNLKGRIYTPSDIALLRTIGVGLKPDRLKSPEELMGASR